MPFSTLHFLSTTLIASSGSPGATVQLLQNIVDGIALGSIYALIALGYTMVYGVLRLINFAHGDVFMVGTYVTFYTVTKALNTGHEPSWGLAALALVLSMLACGVLGVVIERFAYRPVRNAPRLTPLITAIGVSLLLENVANQPFVFGANPEFVPPTVPDNDLSYMIAGVVIRRDDLILLGATLFLLAVLWYLISYTKLGKAMRAVSHDRDAASLMGINIDKVISFTFFLGSALAGAGAFLYAALTRVGLTPILGIMPGIKAFVAAVLGGIGNIPGAALGGFIMGLSEELVKAYGPSVHIPSGYADGAAFLILIAILLVRPSGIFGKGIVEKV